MRSFFIRNCFVATLILCTLLSPISGQDCENGADTINEQYLLCCTGRPIYASENCIDKMMETNKFSPNCLLACMYREYGIYDDLDTLDLDAASKLLDEQVLNENFNAVYKQAFERCSQFEKSNLFESFSFINATNRYGCDKYPRFVDSCVWYYTVANCPSSHIVDSEECNSKTVWLNECIFKE
ncbi:uncharacterized protein [Musca autumnalis]|uniref:uncharacterized protein n=1 Tax=Musca autumnalis TaxID=221902 RepID=UPI003CF20AFB